MEAFRFLSFWWRKLVEELPQQAFNYTKSTIETLYIQSSEYRHQNEINHVVVNFIINFELFHTFF